MCDYTLKYYSFSQSICWSEFKSSKKNTNKGKKKSKSKENMKILKEKLLYLLLV